MCVTCLVEEGAELGHLLVPDLGADFLEPAVLAPKRTWKGQGRFGET